MIRTDGKPTIAWSEPRDDRAAYRLEQSRRQVAIDLAAAGLVKTPEEAALAIEAGLAVPSTHLYPSNETECPNCPSVPGAVCGDCFLDSL